MIVRPGVLLPICHDFSACVKATFLAAAVAAVVAAMAVAAAAAI